MLPVGKDQSALLRDAVCKLLLIGEDQAGHIIPLVIHSGKHTGQRRFNTALPKGDVNEENFLFHFSNPLFSGRMASNAPRSRAASRS